MKKMNKKKLLSIFLATALTMTAFAGCSQDGGSDTTDDATVTTTDAATDAATDAGSDNLTTDEITLKVWESTLGPDEWIKQAGEKFTEQYPNIKIEFVNVELGDTTTQIALDGPAGVGPDLFAAPHDKLGELVTAGHVLPTVDAEKIGSSVLGVCKDALTYNGTMYGYPTTAETYALFYNKELISEDQVPKTWDELITWAGEFNAANPGKHGFVMDTGNIYYSIIFSTYNGNRLFGPSGTDATSSYLATDDSIKGFEVFANLKTILNASASDLTTAFCDGLFQSGTAAMHITGPWNVASFTESDINFGVTTLPALLDSTTPSASFSGTRGMFVSAYGNHPAESAAFAEFLLTEEMQKLRYDITGALPSIELAVDSEASNGFIAQLAYAFPMPSIPSMTAVWESGNAASANIWDGADLTTELQALDATIVAYAAE